MPQPSRVAIYHITHIDNLASIISDGCLWSDRRIESDATPRVVIGYDHIKQRRATQIAVSCHPDTMVGDFVPFYFCPRSPMLYKISRRDGDLAWRGGQGDIVHLVSTVRIAIAAAAGRPWAFSDGNAGAGYTQFSANAEELPTFVNWDAVEAKWWSGPQADPATMSKKMAEFLVHEQFPWTAFRQIGVINQSVADRVKQIIANADHQPQVTVRRQWYY